MAAVADRNLLFGLLALQNGLIDQVQLVAAFQAWTRDRNVLVAEHLTQRGDLDGEQRALLDALVSQHLKKHGGSTAESLAAIPAGPSTLASLAGIGDAEIERTLVRLGSGLTQQGGDADGDRTASYSAGAAASDGQRFRVLRPHAKGGLGVVFVALDTELHREVALKQIHDQQADDPVSRQRFLLEAEVTGGLEHPGIVPVYSLGTYPDGRPYYAMRFVRGESLKEVIEQFHSDDSRTKDSGPRSLELRNLLRRFTDVCNAIEYAHSRGVLHRDIKPGNVIVGKHGETLVVDWGLAKPLGRAEPGSLTGERTLVPSSGHGSSSTLPGSALGTPAYMSPEQADGDLDRLGPRSDVYSLGATLYCLLTGKPPFEGEVADIIGAVLKGKFAPPRALDAGIDKALEAVCLRAMALRPEDRYSSPRALADDLERWMADEPVSAWREPLARRAQRWVRRNRTGVTAAAASVLVALAGTGAVLAVQTRANNKLTAANTDLALANNKITQSNADLVASNKRERARVELAQEAIRTFHTGVSQDVLLKEEPFKALRTKLLRGASEFYRKLETLLQGQQDRESRLSLGRAYLEVGGLTLGLDSIEEANGVSGRAVDLFEGLCRDNPADEEAQRALALSLKLFAETVNPVGRRDEGFAATVQSRDLFRRLLEAHPGDRGLRGECARSEMLHGLALRKEGRLGEALEAIERARSLLETPLKGGQPPEPFRAELQEVYDAWASTLDEAGRHDEAIAAYSKARELGEALFRAKPDDPTTSHELVRTLGNMGISLSGSLHRAEALAAYGRAREVLVAAGGANPTLIRFPAASAWIDTMVAHDLVALGRDEEALEALERARAAREILVKANPAVTRNLEQLFSILHQTVAIHRRAARLPKALAALEQARAIAASLANAHPSETVYQINLSSTCADLGEVHAEMHNLASVLSCFEDAIAIVRKMVAADPAMPSSQARFADKMMRRGRALQRCGQPALAASDFRESIVALRRLNNRDAVDIYDTACAQSLLSAAANEAGSGLTAADARAAAEEAMSTLRAAAAAGYRDARWMGNDPDLAPLRSRSDFQMLRLDMAFPADAFARGN
jgi:serine/threonine-protein kinase